MKNRIWLGKNADGLMMASFEKIKINARGLFQDVIPGTYTHCSGNTFGGFGANLERGQVIELEYDAVTGEVKRPREIGWYLTVNPGAEVNFAAARHWNGEMWKLRPREKLHCSDGDVAVVSEIIRDNEYLKSLE